MYLINAANNTNDTLFLVLIFILIVVFIAIVLLLFLQNKEIKESLEKNKINDFKSEDNADEINDSEENIAQQEDLDNIEDLQSLTRELEMLPRERVVNMTPYELEQEEKAIISYEELVNNNENNISYTNEELPYEDLVIKKVDLESTNRIELPMMKKNVSNTNINTYEHEEEFLKVLKQLNNLLN